MRKRLGAIWEWWRRDCVPVSMLIVSVMIGYGVWRVSMVDGALRGQSYFGSDYDYLRDLSELGQLGDIRSELVEIYAGLYSIRGTLSGIASQCSE